MRPHTTDGVFDYYQFVKFLETFHLFDKIGDIKRVYLRNKINFRRCFSCLSCLRDPVTSKFSGEKERLSKLLSP